MSSARRVVAISFGILAVSEDGSLWSWGSNLDGQLGNGRMDRLTTPTRVVVLDGVVE